jgi:hypothetical protein
VQLADIHTGAAGNGPGRRSAVTEAPEHLFCDVEDPLGDAQSLVAPSSAGLLLRAYLNFLLRHYASQDRTARLLQSVLLPVCAFGGE